MTLDNELKIHKMLRSRISITVYNFKVRKIQNRKRWSYGWPATHLNLDQGSPISACRTIAACRRIFGSTCLVSKCTVVILPPTLLDSERLKSFANREKS